MDLKYFFKNLFKRPIIQESFLTRTPDNLQKEMQRDYHIKKLLQEKAQNEVVINKLNKELKKQEEIKREEKEEKEIEKQIIKRKDYEKKLERSNSLIFQVKGVKKSPVLFTKFDKPLGKFFGFWAKSTREGITLWYPVIKMKNKLMKIECPARNYMDFFKSPLHIPEQIKSGKIDTNVDFDKEGRAVIIKDKDIFEKLYKKQYGKDVSIIKLDAVERMNYEKEISDLKQDLRQYGSMLQELKEKEVMYESELNKTGLTNSYLQKDRDIHAAHTSNLQEKQIQMVSETAKANAGLQDAVINQIQSEKLAHTLMENYDKLVEKMSKYLPEDKRQVALMEAKEILESNLDFLNKVKTPTKIVVTPEKEARKKEEEKMKKDDVLPKGL